MPLQPINSPKSGKTRGPTVAEFVVVIVCTLAFLAFVLGIGVLMTTGNHASGRDVVSFWAAGCQIVHHRNPYDSEAILAIERSVGFASTAQVLIMRNPPSALCLVIPLGLFGLRLAALLWALLLLGALVLSVHMLWVMYGRPKDRLHLLGYSFGPALACILGGQTSLFALLGLVIFLRFHRDRQFVAGVALWLCALKPHLFLPFGAALLMWMIVSRAYRLLAGASLSIAASSWVAWHLDPSVWMQYSQMMRSSGIEHEFIPCLAVALRFAIRQHAMWLQYIPAALGCLWAIWFYWTRRDHWNWRQHGALLMLVSIFLGPYSWLTDQALLVPAILLGAYRANTRAQIGLLALASAVIEIAQLFGKSMHAAFFLWTTPFWLAWYLYVSARAARVTSHSEETFHAAATESLQVEQATV